MRWKAIGVLGGMGPDATIEFFQRLIDRTRAPRDQDYPHVIIESNPQIPDRTSHILGDGESPLESLLATGNRLTGAGAELIAIPCNTSHYYIETLQEQLPVPIINMIEATAARLNAIKPAVQRVGILATSGTVAADIFRAPLEPMEILYPSDDEQEELVMFAIYGPGGIKNIGPCDKSASLLREAGNRLIERGAEVIVTACTEISLVLRNGDMPILVVDTLDSLVDETIQQAQLMA